MAESLEEIARREANRLAGGAALYGWRTEVKELPRGGFQVVARHPETRDGVAVTFTLSRNPRKPGISRTAARLPRRLFSLRSRYISFSVATSVLLAPPLVTVQTDSGAQSVPLGLPDVEGCVCCGRTSPPEAELTLTVTGLCHSCALWHISHDPAAVPDSGCRHTAGPWHPDGLYLFDHRWRTDPRASLGYGSHSWFRARGVKVEFPRGVQDEYGYFLLRHEGARAVLIEEDHGYVEVTVYAVKDETGATVRHRHRCYISQPARHELLDILVAFDPGKSEEQRAAAVARLALNDDAATRRLARHAPQWEAIDEAVQVESILLGDVSSPRRRR